MTTILVIHRIALTRIVVNRKREIFLAGTLIRVGPMPGPHPAPAAQAASPPPGEGLGQAKGRKRTDIDSAPTVKWRSPQRPPGQRITRGRRNRWNTGGGNTRSAAARDSKREAAASPMTPPVIRPMVCAAPWSFVCRGTAQGRRDHRPLPHRFSRPPYARTGGPTKWVRLFIKAFFLLGRPWAGR